jgi:hypothetical protein
MKSVKTCSTLSLSGPPTLNLFCSDVKKQQFTSFKLSLLTEADALRVEKEGEGVSVKTVDQ